MRNLPAVLTLVFLVTALSISLWSARADQPKPEKTAPESNDHESVKVRLARAHVELAKLDVRRVLEINQRVPNVFSAEFIEKLRLHVVIDEAHLEQCLKREDADLHEVCIRSAEAAVKIAEADLKRKRATYQRMPTDASALHVERAAVVAKIAKLNLERTQHLEDSESVLTHLQWQIDELQHQVLELQMRGQN
jgi:hypothetical protein